MDDVAVGLRHQEMKIRLDHGTGPSAKRKTAAYRPTEKPSPYWIKIKNPHVLQFRCRTRSIKDLGHVRNLGPDVGRSLMWCFVRIFSGGRWEREISLKYVRFRMEIQHQAGMKFERETVDPYSNRPAYQLN